MSAPWEKYGKQADSSDSSPWAKYKSPDAPSESERAPVREKHSVDASAGRKGLAGALAGFSDEVMGAGEAAGRALGIEGAGSRPVSEIEFKRPTLDMETLKESYHKGREHERQMLKEDKQDHPYVSGASEFAGGVLSPMNKATQGMGLIKAGAMYGGVAGLGNSESEDLSGMAADTLQGTALGAGLGVGAKVVGKAGGYVIDKAKPLANKVGQKLSKVAGDLAENATGATRVQAEKFEDGAGRELLDRGLVKFGDTPGSIAKRVGAANDKAAGQIQSALKTLDAKGVKVSQDSIVDALEARAKELDKQASQAGVAKSIRSTIDDILNTGESSLTASAAEQEKRGFGTQIRNWAEPQVGAAKKEAYLAYRDGVERAAQDAAPETAALFKEGKKTFGLLSPIEEAAERRAIQLQQSPVGNLRDMGSMIAAGPKGPLIDRMISPRISSSAAVTLDAISKKLLQNPEIAAKAAADPKGFQSIVQSIVQKAHTENAALPAAASNELDRDSSRSSNFREPGSEQAPEAAPTPKPQKGPERWAQDGAEAVAKADPSLDMQSLIADPKAKKLLVTASTLKPGSRAMNEIIDRLRKHGSTN